MIRYYKTIDSKLEKLSFFEDGCWINLVEPNHSEINEISNLLNIDVESIESALDEEERSRIDVEDNHTLILIDIPVDESDSNSSHYTTIPLGIILTEEAIVTVCDAQTKILNDFIVGHIKDFLRLKRLAFCFKFFTKCSLLLALLKKNK